MLLFNIAIILNRSQYAKSQFIEISIFELNWNWVKYVEKRRKKKT